MTGNGSPERSSRGDRAGLRIRVVNGVFWTATGNWVNELVRLTVFALLAHLLEPEAFGLVALALVFVGFTQVIADQGMADALIQRKRLDPDHLDSAFWMSMAFGLLSAGILVALAVPLALLLDQEALAPVLIALALAIPISSASLVQRAILTREMAFRSLAVRTMIAVGVGAVFGIAFALLGLGVWSLVGQQIAVAAAGVLVLWRVSHWRPRLVFSFPHFRELVGFGIHVVNFRLLNYFTRRMEELLIGAFLGPAALGFYAVGYRMLRLLFQVTSSIIDKVAFPLYSQLQDQPAHLRSAYYKTTSFVALLALPAFATTLVLAPQIVAVLFGPKWTEAVPVMQVLSLFGAVQVLTYLNSTLIKALGKPSWQVRIIAVTAAVKLAAFLVAVRYGLIAVAVAATCVGYLMAPLWYWAVNRLAPIKGGVYLANIRGPILATALAAGAMFGLREALGEGHALLTLLVAGTAGVLVYLGAIHLLARPLADEARKLARRALPTLRATPVVVGGDQTAAGTLSRSRSSHDSAGSDKTRRPESVVSRREA